MKILSLTYTIYQLKSVHLKFIYSEKATKLCEIFTLLLTAVHTVKSKVKISQNFVAFSEYMNFKMDLPNLVPKRLLNINRCYVSNSNAMVVF